MVSNGNKSWIAGLGAAVAASLCCITPVIVLIGGTGYLAASSTWLEPIRPYSIGLTIAILGFAWYQRLKRSKSDDCNCRSQQKNNFLNSKVFLGVTTIAAALLIAFPYYAHTFYEQSSPKAIAVEKNNVQQAEFEIKGMTCSSCAAYVNNKLSRLDGLIEYRTSYKKKNCTVKFDNTKTRLSEIENAINSTGYKVIRSSLIN